MNAKQRRQNRQTAEDLAHKVWAKGFVKDVTAPLNKLYQKLEANNGYLLHPDSLAMLRGALPGVSAGPLYRLGNIYTQEIKPVPGKLYRWKGQPDRLIYREKLGSWHQFARVEHPTVVWCEVLDMDLHMLEEIPPSEGERA